MYSDKNIIDIVHKVLDTYDEWGRVIFTDFNVIDYIDRNEVIEKVLFKKPYYENAKRLSSDFKEIDFVDYFNTITRYQTIIIIRRESKRIVREFKINNFLNE